MGEMLDGDRVWEGVNFVEPLLLLIWMSDNGIVQSQKEGRLSCKTNNYVNSQNKR